MEKELLNIIQFDPFGTTIDAEKLDRYTRRHPLSALLGHGLGSIMLSGVKALYLIRKWRKRPEDQICYLSKDGKWLLVVGMDSELTARIVSRCGNSLRILYIDYGGVLRFRPEEARIQLRHLQGLKELTLCHIHRLLTVDEISRLTNLEKLNIKGTSLGPDLDITNLKALKSLCLEWAGDLRNIVSLEDQTQLESLMLTGTAMGPVLNVSRLIALRTLDVCSNKDLVVVHGIEGLARLEELTVHNALGQNSLDVRGNPDLKVLSLDKNKALSELHGLETLSDLNYLSLADTSISGSLDIRGKKLRNLDISETGITELVLDHPMPEMWRLYASGSGLSSTEVLRHFPNLERLEMRRCPVRRLEYVDQLPKLSELDLMGTPVSSIEDINFPPSLVYMILSGTRINRLSESIRGLYQLEYLDLDGLELEELPDWLPELNLPFNWNENGDTMVASGINLSGTKVKGVDMGAVFGQPQELILQWFEKRKLQEGAPLNEVKVIFLGDGEAGKTHTIARLLRDGAQLDFKEDTTPGIVISNKDYDLGDRRVTVHYWDFGGQDILHSMHRIFLTEGTLYVVLLNARDNTQNDRARYWLHNVKSFAGGAPVLLVLNKIDQNDNASVNENDLRAMYSHLTGVVRLSARDFSTEEFNRGLTDKLLEEVQKIDTIDTFFPNAWKQVKNQLENMDRPYISGNEYKQLCAQAQVEEPIRENLLSLFKTLGVSFFYSGAKLEDYVVLRPDWITNAIYTILFNRRKGVTNGIVPHETIYRLLKPVAGDKVKRVMPDVAYTPGEVAYVLDVIRRFRLSYQVEPEVEFIPMLCESNSLPVAAAYETDPETLEFGMVYDYLPNNVIHRLMVELRMHLDREQVWLTGALFREPSKGFSSVVKSEGNVLRIFVRAEKERYTADMYLDTIKSALEQINEELGLRVAENRVVYKVDGKSEAFNYDKLIKAQNRGMESWFSEAHDDLIPIAQILCQTAYRVDRAREQLILDVVRACQKMQDNRDNWDKDEDGRTTYIRDILGEKYEILDQTRGGRSELGKSAGELDLKILREHGVPWTIFEALNLTGKGDSQIDYWDRHLKKLLDNYNANGLPFLFHVSYVKCAKEKFGGFCTVFFDHLRFHSPDKFLLRSSGHLRITPDGYEPNHYIQAAQCVYDCDGFRTKVFHIFVQIGE